MLKDILISKNENWKSLRNKWTKNIINRVTDVSSRPNKNLFLNDAVKLCG